jgi:hypothetical protein
MKPGDDALWGWWLTGRETRDDLEAFSRDTADKMRQESDEGGIVFGPISVETMYPGDEGTPPVPNDVSGPDVRLLVTRAKVVAYKHPIAITPIGFVHDLEPDDLALLMRLTRKQYARAYPNEPRLTDRQCHTLINDLGPDVAVETLRNMTPSDLH